jgi:hypothetical protein
MPCRLRRIVNEPSLRRPSSRTSFQEVNAPVPSSPHSSTLGSVRPKRPPRNHNHDPRRCHHQQNYCSVVSKLARRNNQVADDARLFALCIFGRRCLTHPSIANAITLVGPAAAAIARVNEPK